MKDLPDWIRKVVEEDSLTCGACDKGVTLKELFSVGIKKSVKKPHNEVLAIGLECRHCKEMTFFEFNEMTLLDLAFEILEEESKVSDKKNRKELDEEMGVSKGRKSNRVRSKITVKEIKKSVEMLNKLETHDDFLMALGMSLEEIDSYKLKKYRKGKK